jgi:hypothetical protein
MLRPHHVTAHSGAVGQQQVLAARRRRLQRSCEQLHRGGWVAARGSAVALQPQL